jgi:Fe-S-cluster-containing dehydrogenase component/CRP-like cAMP-binding protein
MPPAPTTIERPQRWSAAFDPNMNDAAVERLLRMAPFSGMNEDRFKRAPLRGILKFDASIRRFRKGEIIVRQGDYGTSAFLILSGTTRVVLHPPLPLSVLGRKAPVKKGLAKTLAQLWSSWKPPESFKPSQLRHDRRVGARAAEDDEQVHVFLQDVPRVLGEHRTEAMSAGDFFGEIAALSRMPRTSTIFAESDEAELLEIRWQGLRDLLNNDDQLRKHIDKIYRERALATFLRATPLFRHLNPAQLAEVALQVEFSTYGDYDWSGEYKRLARAGTLKPEKEPVIFQQGDYPNGIVQIRAGFGRVSQKFGAGERTLNYIGAGQLFGLREIAHNWREPNNLVNFQHTLRAIGYSHILVLPTKAMEQIVLPNLPLKELPPPYHAAEIEEARTNAQPLVPETRETGTAFAEHPPIQADVLEFLTQNRFFNGTAAMVIDLDRCTRCDDCVRACAATHDNNPRFLRHGPTHGRMMIANACMHCTDPVCMIGCPTGAIHRESFAGEVVINPATCIGCKTCYLNCPYDAIRMVDVRHEGGAFMLGQDLKRISKATKCDLCVENHGGPACQRACPHGALERMNLNNLAAMATWLKR